MQTPMAEIERLTTLFQSGHFIHPRDPARSSFADLAHAVAILCGGQPADGCDLKTKALVDEIGISRRHIVFVLCD